ncbi:MAG: fasciclin domain-containing protein [Anaerolineae bacterium]|nr:fasciclin domain-containing protein [Anaerolineae bacterium]
MKRVIVVTTILLLLALAVLILRNDEAAEKASEAINNLEAAGENAGEAVQIVATDAGAILDDTGKEIEQAAEDVGLDEVGEKVEEGAGQVAENAGDQIEKAGDQIEAETDDLNRPSVAEIIENQPELSSFKMALDQANLTDKLADGGPYTVFAPSNTAFRVIGVEPTETVLLYHIVPDEMTSDEIRGQRSLRTEAGDTITVAVTQNTILLNGTIPLTVTDIQASNGVIHLVDAVLKPSAGR